MSRGNLDHSGLRWAFSSPFLATAWIPEGLLLTPRSAAAPHGYGFPKRTPGILETVDGVDRLTGGEFINPPFGTSLASEEKECMNQVLINQYPNNKYLDKPGFITGLSAKFKLPEVNARLRDTIETEVKTSLPKFVSWPLAYTPRSDTITFWDLDENRLQWIDEPGENSWYGGLIFKPFERPEFDSDGKIVGEIPGRQFDENGQSLLYETESTTDWYCHWPEELLYDNAAFEEIFRMTNEYRAAVGRAPLVREVRGPVNYARMILSEMQRARIQFHENEAHYRPGTAMFLDRAYNGGGVLDSFGENLVSGISGQFSITSGNSAADAWRHSPPHYANMINTLWTEDGYCTSLDVFSVKATVTESGPPYPNTFDPPISGTSYAQNFIRRDRWLYAGEVGNANSLGRVSSLGRFSPVGDPFAISAAAYIAYQGRLLRIQQIIDFIEDEIEVRHLGGTLFSKNGVPYIRVLFMRKTGDLSWVFMSYILSTKDLAADWELESESAEFDNLATPTVSTATFKPDGTEGVFSVTRIVFSSTTGFHLDTTLEHPLIRTIEQVAIQYVNGTFSVLEVATGPEVTYTVVDRTEGETVYLSRYTQEGGGEIDLYPAYNAEGSIVRLKLTSSIFVEQEEDTGSGETYIEGKDEVNIHDFITLPSERTMVITHYHMVDKAFVGEAYFLIFHHLDLVTEDMVYSRIDCSMVGESIYGTLTLYVNDVIVKTIPSQLISDFEITHRSIRYETSGGNTLAVGTRDLTISRSHIANGDRYCVLPYTNDDIYSVNYVVCTAKPTIRYYYGRLLEGTQAMALGGRDSNFVYCYSGTKGDDTYFCGSYNPMLPLGAYCIFARYKDKVVVQFLATRIFSFEIPEEEQRFVYANFDLNEMVGIGDMKFIYPLGVV